MKWKWGHMQEFDESFFIGVNSALITKYLILIYCSVDLNPRPTKGGGKQTPYGFLRSL